MSRASRFLSIPEVSALLGELGLVPSSFITPSLYKELRQRVRAELALQRSKASTFEENERIALQDEFIKGLMKNRRNSRNDSKSAGFAHNVFHDQFVLFND